MSVVVGRPHEPDRRFEEPKPNTPPRSARWAARLSWLALALTPVLVAVSVGSALAHGEEDTTWVDSLGQLVVAIAAPAVALVLGIWAARSGRHSGAVAAWVAAPVLVVLAVWGSVSFFSIF